MYTLSAIRVPALLWFVVGLTACGGGSGGSDGITYDVWGSVERIDNISGPAGSPKVARSSGGTAVAVWSKQEDGTSVWDIWANVHDGSNWGNAARIEFSNVGDAGSPDVGMDAGGNAIVVWTEMVADVRTVRAKRYTPAGGWGPFEVIEGINATAPGALAPRVAVNEAGRAVATWQQATGSGWEIYANVFNGTNWDTAVRLSPDGSFPKVAIDGAGNAYVGWIDGGAVWISYFDAVGVSWSPAQLLGTATFMGDVSASASGHAAAIWTHNDAVYATVFDGSTWPAAEQIGTGAGANVGVDDAGNAIASWTEPLTDSDSRGVWANRYVPGVGWGTAQSLDQNAEGNGQAIVQAVTPGGAAVFVWEFMDDQNTWNIRANRYSPATGWGTEAMLETIAGEAREPDVAIDPTGNALAVWKHDQMVTVNSF